MSLIKNKYIVIKKVIDKDLSDFCYNYLRVKKQVYDTCIKNRYISPFEEVLGKYETDKDQVANTYSTYGDIAMDTLMLKIQPIMEQKTKLKLTPAYTYARVYKKGDILKRHKDRFSCEISTTLNLGGDNWPIYVEPSGKENKKGVKVNLKPGDMLIYLGCELEHWREPFEGDECVQVFLHYNNVKTKGAQKNMFDGRLHIGLPGWFKNNGK
jgi:hypothetical protein|tara:strand:- start:1056 stop:1688 length:633 start_codon:yes stop_codon:yes gene_type:complete